MAVGGFGDTYRKDLGSWGEGRIELGGELVGDVFGDVLCGRVERIEGGDIVEIVVGEGLADLDEGLFYEVEVAEEPFIVEAVFARGAGDDGGGFEVVAMGWFLGAQEDDGVGGAELVGDLDLETLGGEHERW